jgi:PAS domain S-box-containing protein
LLQKLATTIVEAWEQAAAAEDAARSATSPDLRSGYERMARSWRRVGETCEFIGRLERFLVEAERAKTAQRPKAQNELSSLLIGSRADELPQHFANLVNSSDDAMVSVGLNGTIKSWNRAAEHIFRYSAEEAVGKSIKMLIPREHRREEEVIQEHVRRGERVECHETRRRRKDGTLIDISLTVSPVRDATGRIVGASKISRDITYRRGAREQTAADVRAMTLLRELGVRSVRKDISFNQCLQDFVEAAIAIAQADKGNLHVFDTGLGALIIAAQCGFESPFLEFFERVSRKASACAAAMDTAERVIVDDVMTSGIFVGQPSQRALLEAGVRAVASTPLMSSDGDVLGVISVYFQMPHRPSERELGLIDLLARQAADYLARKRNEEITQMLVREIQHRSNNLLSVVQAIASGSFSGNLSLADARAAFEARLQSLARANLQLTSSPGGRLNLRDVVRLALEPFADRISVEGDDLVVGPQYAQYFALALHELATNGAKYGALSNTEGRVAISWAILGTAQKAALKFAWRELRGPPVRAPTRTGFGTSLLRATFQDAQLNFAAEGLSCEVVVLLDRVTGKEQRAQASSFKSFGQE